MIAEHTQTTTEAPIVLQCVDLCKCYNGVVQASDHINFTLRRGARLSGGKRCRKEHTDENALRHRAAR